MEWYVETHETRLVYGTWTFSTILQRYLKQQNMKIANKTIQFYEIVVVVVVCASSIDCVSFVQHFFFHFFSIVCFCRFFCLLKDIGIFLNFRWGLCLERGPSISFIVFQNALCLYDIFSLIKS